MDSRTDATELTQLLCRPWPWKLYFIDALLSSFVFSIQQSDLLWSITAAIRRNPVPIQKTSPSYSKEHFHFQFIRTMKKHRTINTKCNKSINTFLSAFAMQNKEVFCLFSKHNMIYLCIAFKKQQVEILIVFYFTWVLWVMIVHFNYSLIPSILCQKQFRYPLSSISFLD